VYLINAVKFVALRGISEIIVVNIGKATVWTALIGCGAHANRFWT